MSKRQILETAIRKSATGPDETKYLLSALDEALAEEIEAQDKLLLSEIEDLTGLSNDLINVLNKQANEIASLEQELEQHCKKERDLDNAFAAARAKQ